MKISGSFKMFVKIYKTMLAQKFWGVLNDLWYIYEDMYCEKMNAWISKVFMQMISWYFYFYESLDVPSSKLNNSKSHP